MKKIVIIIAALSCTAILKAQNVFPVKLEGCNTSQFCLDCGDPKANYDQADFDKLVTTLNSKYKLKGISGKIGFQVLVDSLGKPCVLSHTDQQSNKITLDA